MTGKRPRPPVPDRARRRAIRALAAQLGVPYSVAARLLYRPNAQLFAVREHRPFALRVADTRLAADLPLGRPAHLAERFPRLPTPAGTLFDGEGRSNTLAMLYAVIAHELPAVLPGAEELAWVAELGEEAAVDITCASVDRAARLLLDGDRWQLWTRIDAALVAGEAADDRAVRDAARTLGQEFRTVVRRGSLDGARQTLDAVLVAPYQGHPPGTRLGAATVVGAHWTGSGPPTGYDLRTDDLVTT
jgi:hypothetical protein